MADVANTLAGWSSTTNSNSPSGSASIGTGLDDNLREIQGVIVRGLSHKGSDIASATAPALGGTEGLFHDITGTATITGFDSAREGLLKIVKFEGAATLTHNATSLILPGGANITTADGDVAIFISEGSGNWRCLNYMPVGQSPITNTLLTNALSGNVLLNNTSNYFDGPSVAQGTAGTWFASGTIVCSDTASAATFNVKLWDGTTVISSGVLDVEAINHRGTITLSGYITSPAGNIRISAKDTTSTNGFIAYDASGNAKDSKITVIRIA